VAVIADPENDVKLPFTEDQFLPVLAVLDPEVTVSLPARMTAATGMDALTHAVESYLSKAASPATEAQAKAAVKLIFENLVTTWHDGGDLEARDAMALAAFYAGSAFGRTSVGYVHGIAHQLGRICGTPHGNANAMVLPEVLAAYGPVVHPRLAELARVAGISGDGNEPLAKAFIDKIAAMRGEMEMPTRPQGLERDHIGGIVKEAIAEAGSLYPVPRYMSKAEIASVVEGLLAA
jgi:alcohol dehydrogenase class IV